MKFYDLNIKGYDYERDLALLKEAYKFGWNYLNLTYSPDYFEKALNYKDDLISELESFESSLRKLNCPKDFNSFKINLGLEIKSTNQNEIRKTTNKFRKKANYISVFTSGDTDCNRAVLENRRIDVLSRPYFKSRYSGINHVLAKKAVKNNVAIELSFKDILSNYISYRAKVISSFRDIIALQRKYKFHLIFTSGASSIYDIRSAFDLFAFFKTLNLSDSEIKNGFYTYPKSIVDFNKERPNMLFEGVKKVDRCD